MLNKRFNYPDEMDFLSVFGVEPLESQPKDGFWCYLLSDDNQRQVKLSFDMPESSIQTTLIIDGLEISTVSSEGAEYLNINDKTIRGKCQNDSDVTELLIKFEPHLQVTWSNLRI
ncbi:hypothetical protein PN36_34280 [Candidatus Thiomargarita nelsonii]|uniref:Uncharacterized protein n=1 Tax=Candidatus Thiomargarita nelsonii TaxID=1003181 RepID=A0A0A6PKZ2_9GAMM|nr:hypothetical protein PN36_34280 [Candidatus Thiomargarita nelsonii]